VQNAAITLHKLPLKSPRCSKQEQQTPSVGELGSPAEKERHSPIKIIHHHNERAIETL
jgi:hypothetical protein